MRFGKIKIGKFKCWIWRHSNWPGPYQMRTMKKWNSSNYRDCGRRSGLVIRNLWMILSHGPKRNAEDCCCWRQNVEYGRDAEWSNANSQTNSNLAYFERKCFWACAVDDQNPVSGGFLNKKSSSRLRRFLSKLVTLYFNFWKATSL